MLLQFTTGHVKSGYCHIAYFFSSFNFFCFRRSKNLYRAPSNKPSTFIIAGTSKSFLYEYDYPLTCLHICCDYIHIVNLNSVVDQQLVTLPHRSNMLFDFCINCRSTVSLLVPAIEHVS